ncbi:hypothetical protein EVAR_55990_1 [Eumeta japonica]|uniref:Uncharacterized protein n=1 Tax=Eumeta variegata TaxID=151549 RepID=A0A4C1Y6D3_EUMVA|nr:hypothetical protein EVAR_55990_1 [Eumeta japonica]
MVARLIELRRFSISCPANAITTVIDKQSDVAFVWGCLFSAVKASRSSGQSSLIAPNEIPDHPDGVVSLFRVHLVSVAVAVGSARSLFKELRYLKPEPGLMKNLVAGLCVGARYLHPACGEAATPLSIQFPIRNGLYIDWNQRGAPQYAQSTLRALRRPANYFTGYITPLHYILFLFYANLMRKIPGRARSNLCNKLRDEKNT